jgi:virulence-associated protein VapD
MHIILGFQVVNMFANSKSVGNLNDQHRFSYCQGTVYTEQQNQEQFYS